MIPVPECVVDALHPNPTGVHTVLAVLFCSKPQARIALQFMTTFKATNTRPTRRRKDFESTRAYAGELSTVLVDQDKKLQLVV